MLDLQILSKGKTISTEALRKFTARRKWQVRDTLFAAPAHLEHLEHLGTYSFTQIILPSA